MQGCLSEVRRCLLGGEVHEIQLGDGVYLSAEIEKKGKNEPLNGWIETAVQGEDEDIFDYDSMWDVGYGTGYDGGFSSSGWSESWL